jgi:hypothetical protein
MRLNPEYQSHRGPAWHIGRAGHKRIRMFMEIMEGLVQEGDEV